MIASRPGPSPFACSDTDARNVDHIVGDSGKCGKHDKSPIAVPDARSRITASVVNKISSEMKPTKKHFIMIACPPLQRSDLFVTTKRQLSK